MLIIFQMLNLFLLRALKAEEYCRKNSALAGYFGEAAVLEILYDSSSDIASQNFPYIVISPSY